MLAHSAQDPRRCPLDKETQKAGRSGRWGRASEWPVGS